MLNADFLPCTWRSVLTKGCIETGTETWKGGANYYTVAQISVGGVDAANGLMAVKDLVFDKKKLTMAELKAALAANFEGEYEKVHKMCYQDAPKYGNDIDEADFMVRRVNNSVLAAFNEVDGGGNYISKDIKTSLDQYTKSVHNLMGMVTGALPNGKKAGVALTDGSLSAMPGTDTKGATALVMSATKGNDPVKWCATHMNMKLPPDQLKYAQGSGQRDEPGPNLVHQRGLSHPVQRAGYREAERRPETSGKLPRPRGARGRLQRLLHQAPQGRAGRSHRADLAALLGKSTDRSGVTSVTPDRNYYHFQPKTHKPMLSDSHFYFHKAADVLGLSDQVRTILLTPRRTVKIGINIPPQERIPF